MSGKQTISLAGIEIDPETEAQNQDNANDAPTDRAAPIAWIVQFREPLSSEDVTALRDRFGLTLDDFVPESSYIERQSQNAIDTLRADPRVRAIARYLPRFKVSTAARNAAQHQDEENDVPRPPPSFDAVLFPGAAPDQIAIAMQARGAIEPATIDDREHGGGVTIRFRLDDVTRVQDIAAIEAVRWVEPVPETVDDASAPSQPPSPGFFHALDGAGQVIGLIDNGGPDLRHCFFRDNDGIAPGPSHRKILQVRNARGSPASDHATFTAGLAAGDDLSRPGAAPDRGIVWAAKLVLGNRLDLDQTTMLAELTAAAAAGAYVHSNSFHSKPQGPRLPATYDERARSTDSFCWTNEDHLVVASSGNTGEEQGPPGSAKNALCVSCTPIDPEQPIGDGASGPTADGRMKPEIAADGCHARSALKGTLCDAGELVSCASSFATPRAAAAAVIARQYFMEGYHPTGVKRPEDALTPSGALLKALLVNVAAMEGASHPVPNNDLGWGTLRLDKFLPLGAAASELRIVDVRNVGGLSIGQSYELLVNVADSSRPLNVVLAWTEPPGASGADDPVVNNLDLVVTAPSGAKFLGNAMLAGVSIEGGEPDARNNVEKVIISAPDAGLWHVLVQAVQVVSSFGTQGFALAISGNLIP